MYDASSTFLPEVASSLLYHISSLYLHSVVFRTKLLTFPRLLLTLVTRNLEAHFLRNAEDSAGLTKQIPSLLVRSGGCCFLVDLSRQSFLLLRCHCARVVT